jgi:membrane-bound lytic murein transglycosylase D
MLFGLTIPRLSPQRFPAAIAPLSPARTGGLSPSSLSGPIWGYFHPAWVPGGTDRFGSAALARLSRDPNRRIDPEFQSPEALRPRVLFWAAIYSRFDSRTKIIHDREDPSLIYGYLDFNPLYLNQSKMAAALQSERIERAILLKLQGAILGAGSLAASPLDGLHEIEFRRFLVERGFQGRTAFETLARGVRSQTGQSDVFQEALVRARPLLPRMEQVFTEHGLPKTLARIPFVESSFNPHARSKVGALGLWQFVPLTAKEMIHKSDRRKWRDPNQQTRAAARLLRRYRKALPDWPSTVTSYNSGIGRVSRLLTRHETGLAMLTTVDDSELGFAGRNFFAEVLAATLVEAYWRQLFPLDPRLGPFEVAQNRPD